MKTPDTTDRFDPLDIRSAPILFWTDDGKVYAGHYHGNGWFYSDVCGAMAKGPNYKAFGDSEIYPNVVKWKYLDELSEL